MSNNSDAEKHYKYKKKNHKFYVPVSVLRGNTATDLSKSAEAFPGRHHL